MMTNSWNGGVEWWMVLLMVSFLTLVVVGVALLIRSSSGGGQSGPGRQTRESLEILDARFARGEIDKDEYEERRRILKGSG